MKRRLFSWFLWGSIALLTACKSVRVLPNKAPVKRVDLKVLTTEIAKAEENINTFRARIKAVYNDQKRKQQVNVNFRLDNGKTFWMSANMLIPIAKLLVTPRRCSFTRNFKKPITRAILTSQSTAWIKLYLSRPAEYISWKSSNRFAQSKGRAHITPEILCINAQRKRAAISTNLFF